MAICIWGAGAIGGTIGAYLARAGHDILLVDNDSNHVNAINSDGLKIIGPVEEFSVSVKATIPKNVTGKFDQIFLATKTQNTQEAIAAIKPHLTEDGYVLSAQNGLNELIIQKVVGKERTVGALVNFGADYHAPGQILFGGRGAVVLGELDGAITDRLKELHSTMLDFEENSTTTDDILGSLWGKEVFGAIVFITALSNESVADSLADTTYRSVYVEAAREILMLAEKLGARPKGFDAFDPEVFRPWVDASAVDASIDALVAMNRTSGKSHSGIWRDLAVRKRRTEVTMFDVILEEGRRLSVPLRFTQHWTTMIHEIEEGKRSLDVANLDELKAKLS
ncbi:MAG: 2-dehydropantoate 2-reductase [Halioglobus sp.]